VTKQAVIYTRFSPRPNADQCKSCERQEERCRDYCRRHGYEVWTCCSDKDVTGKRLSRPGLNEALDQLGSGMVLVVDSADRLARDMLVALTIRHQVDRAGCQIEFADGSPVTDTPEGELFGNILAAFAGYERARFARRTKAGLAKKLARGEWLGKPPIGHRIDSATKRLVDNPEEQAAVAWAAELSQWGMSSDQIAVALTADAGPCRGRPWNGRTIRKLLANRRHSVDEVAAPQV